MLTLLLSQTLETICRGSDAIPPVSSRRTTSRDDDRPRPRSNKESSRRVRTDKSAAIKTQSPKETAVESPVQVPVESRIAQTPISTTNPSPQEAQAPAPKEPIRREAIRWVIRDDGVSSRKIDSTTRVRNDTLSESARRDPPVANGDVANGDEPTPAKRPELAKSEGAPTLAKRSDADQKDGIPPEASPTGPMEVVPIAESGSNPRLADFIQFGAKRSLQEIRTAIADRHSDEPSAPTIPEPRSEISSLVENSETSSFVRAGSRIRRRASEARAADRTIDRETLEILIGAAKLGAPKETPEKRNVVQNEAETQPVPSPKPAAPETSDKTSLLDRSEEPVGSGVRPTHRDPVIAARLTRLEPTATSVSSRRTASRQDESGKPRELFSWASQESEGRDANETANDTETSRPAEEISPKPLRELTTNVVAAIGEFPQDRAADRFAQEGEVHSHLGESRPWGETVKSWEAPASFHRPLYFEDVNLERHGYTFGWAQPAVSAAHFFSRIPLMPYMMVSERHREPVYTLGHFRPGSEAPFMRHRLPFDTSAGLVEAGVIAGAILVFP